MPYTLMKGLVWVLLAVILGIVIGWLLRSVAAKRQVERARSANLGASDLDELERLRHRVANLEPVVADRDRLRAELDAERRRVASAPSEPPVVPNAASAVAAGGVGGAAVVSARIDDVDDLTAVDGIDPDVAELCRGIGIRTWAELSVTEVSLLRTMLGDAGGRFEGLDPSTWPQQAAALAAGARGGVRTPADDIDGDPTDG